MARRASAAAAVALAGSLYLAFLLRGSYYFVDDYLRLSEAGSATLGWKYLSSSVFGHLVPGWRLTFFILQRIFPFRYTPVVVFESVVQGITLIGLYRLLVVLHGVRWRNLVLLAMYAVSPIMLTTEFWFSNALHVLPSLCFTVLAADAFIRHVVTRRPSYLAFSVLCAVAGLMFYEKPAILLILLPLLILVISTERGTVGDGLRHGLRDVVGRWRTWLAYLVPVGTYFWYYLSHGYYLKAPRPSLAALATALWGAWERGLSIFVIGGPYRWKVYGIAAMERPVPSPLIIVLGQIAVLALIYASVRGDRRAWRGWMLSLVIFGVSFFIVAWGRLWIVGPAIGEDLRYTSDVFLFFVLGISLAFTPVQPALVNVVRGTSASKERDGPAVMPRLTDTRPPRSRILLVSIIAVAYFIGVWINTGPYRSEWTWSVPRVYWTNFFRDLHGMREGGRSFSLYNTAVPSTVRLLQDYPGNLLDVTVAAIYPSLSYNDPTKPMYLVDLSNGHIRPADFASLGQGSLRLPGTLQFSAQPQVKEGAACFSATQQTISYKLPQLLPLGVYFLRLSYLANRSSQVRVLVHTDKGIVPGTVPDPLSLPPDRTAILTTLTPAAISGLELQVSTPGGFCLNELTLGLPATG